ncbi:tryptophan-rich sensory protein [Ponticoccus sp. SC2-23]|uniref:tryptophan-rich sensory protein TspO n=1 Tax=Alexandriicola marinus TaxID=2081710 RepID=UPI000FD6CE3E|nr:TspO/MBR family protein [Alexandriicola marinus]MBM1221732.1 tryptophan-rich sensory protein [Ponticoccus sp. SC6-9]MBM1226083.1 tryptophan-rich sensory protein [Ponticoccus sp. SC6-15]MBM1230680.1 tryptophan-rich sensory protein [Ponticoccus sp. SC6-38]MBM1235480.1 tryptophan-rich sensory protein [Ponticoccus sp. SC6-45]MBM1239701.1 tryptophan-rich sensory protein [Ponticoccus sp. SC6-49]MBM1243845.1 tryptophan-rich sensory protein [Ponticoccus sp. SC2-64]MBM1249003.1 tryptophan-rich sen
MDPLIFVVLLAACFAAGTTGAMFPTGPWYERLEKPSWVPPNWLFPVAWTTIYFLIAFAGARAAPMEGSHYAMAFWALQIALNTLWTPIFFGLRRLKGSLPVMALLWMSVAGCTYTHFQLDFWAGLAFVPYLTWVTVASALNLSVARLNPDEKPVQPSQL